MATTVTPPYIESIQAMFADDTHTEQVLRVTWVMQRVVDGSPLDFFQDYSIVDPSIPLDQDDWDTLWDGALSTISALTGGSPASLTNPVVIAP